MGQLLDVLRAGEEGGDLPSLVRRLAGAGLPVELESRARHASCRPRSACACTGWPRKR